MNKKITEQEFENKLQINYNLFLKTNIFTKEDAAPIDNVDQLFNCLNNIKKSIAEKTEFIIKLYKLIFTSSIPISCVLSFIILNIICGKKDIILFIFSCIFINILTLLIFIVTDLITDHFSWRKKFNQKFLSLFKTFKKSDLSFKYQNIKLEAAINDKDIQYSLMVYLNNLHISSTSAEMDRASEYLGYHKEYLMDLFYNKKYIKAKDYISEIYEYWLNIENRIEANIEQYNKTLQDNINKHSYMDNYLKDIKKFSKDNKLVFLENEKIEIKEDKFKIDLKSIL